MPPLYAISRDTLDDACRHTPTAARRRYAASPLLMPPLITPSATLRYFFDVDERCLAAMAYRAPCCRLIHARPQAARRHATPPLISACHDIEMIIVMLMTLLIRSIAPRYDADAMMAGVLR